MKDAQEAPDPETVRNPQSLGDLLEAMRPEDGAERFSAASATNPLWR